MINSRRGVEGSGCAVRFRLPAGCCHHVSYGSSRASLRLLSAPVVGRGPPLVSLGRFVVKSLGRSLMETRDLASSRGNSQSVRLTGRKYQANDSQSLRSDESVRDQVLSRLSMGALRYLVIITRRGRRRVTRPLSSPLSFVPVVFSPKWRPKFSTIVSKIRIIPFPP